MRFPRPVPRRARRKESGAAVVEFALVSTLLFPLMLGIVDYGLWFNDSLNTRQGVREAARQAIVQTATCTGPATDLQKMACVATREVAPTAGKAWAKVIVPEGWVKTKPLIVCAMVKETGVTGLTPLPNDRIITSMTRMSIEVDTTVPTGAAAGSATWPATTAPASWAWCK